jgi:hypothetical protein
LKTPTPMTPPRPPGARSTLPFQGRDKKRAGLIVRIVCSAPGRPRAAQPPYPTNIPRLRSAAYLTSAKKR